MSTESENGVAKRLDELEAKLTFQDDLLDQLNAVIAHQDALLRQYEQRLSALDSRVRQVAEQVAPEIDNVPPPHY